MSRNILKDISDGRYIPTAHQLAVVLTLPLTVWQLGLWSIPVIFVMSLIYHALVVSMVGHSMLGHRNVINPVVDNILYTVFYYVTFISPALWGGFHIQHHKHADTEKDPQSAVHYGFWRVLIITFWNPTLVDIRTFVSLKKRFMINFIEQHPWLVACIPVLLLAVIPWQYVLLFWQVPASLALTIGTYSAWYTHQYGEPVKDFGLMQKILILGEVNNHASHHDNWSRNLFTGIFK